jgi:hypothetical protein
MYRAMLRLCPGKHTTIVRPARLGDRSSGQTMILVALLSMLLVAGLAATALGRQGGRSPVYSVAALRAGLDRDPGAWLNRTLRVRGVAAPCEVTMSGPNSPCRGGLPVLLDDTAVHEDAALPLGRGRPDPAYAALRRIPLLGHLVPSPPYFAWGMPATYTVEIVVEPFPVAGTVDGYRVLLLDAAP